MTIKIGITGGIGSGKSIVCKIFNLLKVPVFEADKISKQLILNNKIVRDGLVNLFGQGIYLENGEIDRKKLANIIFNDDLKLQKVNNLVHPVVLSEFKKWVNEQNTSYVIHEAAILFESGFYKEMDYNILITAPIEERVRRVCLRDNVSEDQVKTRMQKQWSDNEKQKLATLVIKNNNKELLVPQIIKIDKQLKEYGKIW